MTSFGQQLRKAKDSLPRTTRPHTCLKQFKLDHVGRYSNEALHQLSSQLVNKPHLLAICLAGLMYSCPHASQH
eukprot:861654-Alexandrium_andersonii.AAC.1